MEIRTRTFLGPKPCAAPNTHRESGLGFLELVFIFHSPEIIAFPLVDEVIFLGTFPDDKGERDQTQATQGRVILHVLASRAI